MTSLTSRTTLTDVTNEKLTVGQLRLNATFCFAISVFAGVISLALYFGNTGVIGSFTQTQHAISAGFLAVPAIIAFFLGIGFKLRIPSVQDQL